MRTLVAVSARRIIALAVIVELCYRVVRDDVSQLASARIGHHVYGIGFLFAVALGLLVFGVAARFRTSASGPENARAFAIAAVFTFAALFVFSNVTDGGMLIESRIYFLLNALASSLCALGWWLALRSVGASSFVAERTSRS